jgi:hypothetical protein
MIASIIAAPNREFDRSVIGVACHGSLLLSSPFLVSPILTV